LAPILEHAGYVENPTRHRRERTHD
jgi:hypothetical protein